MPPISMDSSLANVPGSKGDEALNVSEIGGAEGRKRYRSGGARSGRPSWCCGGGAGRTSAR